MTEAVPTGARLTCPALDPRLSLDRIFHGRDLVSHPVVLGVSVRHSSTPQKGQGNVKSAQSCLDGSLKRAANPGAALDRGFAARFAAFRSSAGGGALSYCKGRRRPGGVAVPALAVGISWVVACGERMVCVWYYWILDRSDDIIYA